VCNGNYGNTGWAGLNTLLLSGGTIISSNAKLNDYYMANDGDEEKLYVACHELGHGFGLPHWDEDFSNQVSDPCTNSPCAFSNCCTKGQINRFSSSSSFNVADLAVQDVGNCMDYTNNRSQNNKPDQSNFVFLAELYGGQDVTATKSMEDGGNRHLRRVQRQHTSRLLDVLPHNPQRQILYANKHFEVHLIPSQELEGYWILEHYLLAK
jgi:hypothetical protein